MATPWEFPWTQFQEQKYVGLCLNPICPQFVGLDMTKVEKSVKETLTEGLMFSSNVLKIVPFPRSYLQALEHLLGIVRVKPLEPVTHLIPELL